MSHLSCDLFKQNIILAVCALSVFSVSFGHHICRSYAVVDDPCQLAQLLDFRQILLNFLANYKTFLELDAFP